MNEDTKQFLTMDPGVARKAAGMLYKMTQLMDELQEIGMDFCDMMEGACDSCPVMLASGYNFGNKPEECEFNALGFGSADRARKQASAALSGLRILYAENVGTDPWRSLVYNKLDTVRNLTVLPHKAVSFQEESLVYKLVVHEDAYAVLSDDSVAHFIHVNAGGKLDLKDRCVVDTLVLERDACIGVSGEGVIISKVYADDNCEIEDADTFAGAARDVRKYNPQDYDKLCEAEKKDHEFWENSSRLRKAIHGKEPIEDIK